ncbi:MAG: hypothetical protein LBL82_01945 [Oscillospiraceae bacterium]|jgi:hypothetical protein|nr:hypothetical protein [Oscillospiraceae bacterium]
MLLTLETVQNTANGLLDKLLYNLRKPRADAYLTFAENSTYMKISCEVHKKGINWRRVESFARERDLLLSENDIEIPTDVNLNRFTPKQLPKRLMFNLADSILSKLSVSRGNIRLGISDSGERLKEFLPKVLPMASEIRILMNDTSFADEEAERLVRSCGVPLIVSRESGVLHNCNLVVATDDTAELDPRSRIDLLLSDRVHDCGVLNVAAPEIYLPAVLNSAFSRKYDRVEVASAFYEVADMQSLGGIVPWAGKNSDGVIPAESMTSYLNECCI